MSMIFRNSRGQTFRSGIGGCYPVNDGNPENDCDVDFSALDDYEQSRADYLLEKMEND